MREKLGRLGRAAAAAEDWAADAREARDQAIEQADLDGWSVREIADASGLSRPRVHQVVIARTAARQARATRPAG